MNADKDISSRLLFGELARKIVVFPVTRPNLCFAVHPTVFTVVGTKGTKIFEDELDLQSTKVCLEKRECNFFVK